MPEKTPTGQSKLKGFNYDPLQAQNSLDMLSIALAQTSRDPGLLAQVQLQIQQRQKEAAMREMTALEAQGRITQEAIRQEGATERAGLAARVQLQSTREAAESRERVAEMEERGRTARTVYEQQQITARETGKAGASRALEAAKVAQDIFGDAETLYRQLVTGGKEADQISRMIQLTMADDLARVQAKQKKGEKLSEADETVLAKASMFAGTGQAMSDPQARDVVSQFINTRLTGLETALPETRPMVEAMWAQHQAQWGLVERARVGQIPAEEVGKATQVIVGRLLRPEAETQTDLMNLQLAMTQLAQAYPDDPQAQEDVLRGVMQAVGEKLEGDDPEELERHLATVDAILSDGVSADEYGQLEEILRDMGVEGFYGPPAGPPQPSAMQRLMRTLKETPGSPWTSEQKRRRAERRARREAK